MKRTARFLSLSLLSSPQNPLPCVDRAVSFPEVKGTKLRWQGRFKGAQFCSSVAASPSEPHSSHSFPRIDVCFWQGHSDNSCLAVAHTSEVAQLHLLPLPASSGVGKVTHTALSHHWEERSRHSLVEQRMGWVQTGRHKTALSILCHHSRWQTGVYQF